MTCTDCKGTGAVWAPGNDASPGYDVECPSCQGSALRVTSPTRIDLARDLARIKGAINSVSLDAHLAQFATSPELDAFRAGLALAMDEVERAEAVLHDMWLGTERVT